jgi:hypothetical protein
MPQTRPNGGQVPVNSDPYNLTADMATQTDTLNVIAPVPSDAAETALIASGLLFPGYAIVRTDLASLPIFLWDGAGFEQKTGLRHAEYTGPIVTTSAGIGTNVGALTEDEDKSEGNDFVQPDTAGRLKILKTGVYAVTMLLRPSATPGKTNVYIKNVTEGENVAPGVGGDYGVKEVGSSSPNLYLAANTVLEFDFATANAVNLGSLVTVTKWQ